MSSLMDRLKNNRGKQAAAIKQAAQSKGGYQVDERIWKYSGVDTDKLTDKGKKQQYSYTEIRFLPESFVDMQRQENGELAEHQVLSPIVTVIRNNFKNKGKFFNEYNRREMLGEDCPINEHDRSLWEAWKEEGKPDNETKKILVERLPKSEYYANILVVDDKAKPENNGKVFLFRFTQAIMGMINEALEPSMPGKDPIDPFDIFEGRNLVLQFMMPEQTFGNWKGFAPKDIPKESFWKNPSPLAETEEKIEEIMTQAYSLTEFTDIKHFKSYDELQKRFSEVMGYDTTTEPESNTSVESNAGASGDTSSAPKQQIEDTDVEDHSSAPKQQVQTESQQQAQTGGNFEDEMDELERMLQE